MEKDGERENADPFGRRMWNPRVPAVTSMRDAAHCLCLRTAVETQGMTDEPHGWGKVGRFGALWIERTLSTGGGESGSPDVDRGHDRGILSIFPRTSPSVGGQHVLYIVLLAFFLIIWIRKRFSPKHSKCSAIIS